MSEKHDRTAARTAADIERKYSFGKKFSEILGLIDDSRDKVDSVESKLTGKIDTATTLARSAEVIAATAKATADDAASQVSLKMDANAVDIAIDKKLANGVEQVETSTGYRFDYNGLNISRAGEEMTNLLDNTGMYVKRSDENILSANNNGVAALNLHAKTYLIIGSGNGRSRLEDYGIDRVGVFWVG